MQSLLRWKMSGKAIEQELELYGHGFFQTVGDSMEPLLHNRCSTVVIEKKKKPLKKYDVALFRRPTGEYVLHRVLKVLNDSYIICGDNRLRKEKIPEEWIIGVMAGYFETEENNFISCESRRYRRYLSILIWRRWRLWQRRQIRRIIKAPGKLAYLYKSFMKGE